MGTATLDQNLGSVMLMALPKENWGLAGIGRVLHDNKGQVLSKFAASVGVRDSNEAEFLVIVTALEISLEREWRKRGRLIVESDSKVVVHWVKATCP